MDYEKDSIPSFNVDDYRYGICWFLFRCTSF